MDENKKLSFTQLIGVIIGSTIGSGIYTTAGDMAASGAYSAAVIIGWAVCGIGMFGLMMCFFGLSRMRPDAQNGIYSYVREGFGDYLGYLSAWGYWFASMMANVSILTLIFSALGFFIPAFGSGNNLIAIVCASALLWLMTSLVLKGVKEAAIVNVVTTICKLIPIFVFIIAAIFASHFKLSIFLHNFTGDGSMSLIAQARTTNAATVWSFLGVESVVVICGRARNKKDVGRASITGFLGILAIYILVCLLSYGVMLPEEIAQLDSPQLAGILASIVGPVGSTIVIIGLALSLIGSALSWTIINAECPFEAAQLGAFPKAFTRRNANGAPTFSVLVSAFVVQAMLIVVLFSEATYTVLYTMTATMAVFPYSLITIFYSRLAFRGLEGSERSAVTRGRVCGVIGVIYSIWLLYCSSWYLLLPAMIMYALGIVLYIPARREQGQKLFGRPWEAAVLVLILALAVLAAVLMCNGTIVLV